MAATAEFSDDAVLGRGLPPRVEGLIREAGLLYGEPFEALQRLEQARALAPGHPAVLIALYRFHFYGNRLAAAREVALEAMACAAAKLGLPGEWQRVAPNHQLFGGLAALPRFYLFALKGYAYLSLRLGDEETGTAALAVLRRLDPLDRIGGRVLEHVLERRGRDDYDDDFAGESA
jgi:hypothetical protein